MTTAKHSLLALVITAMNAQILIFVWAATRNNVSLLTLRKSISYLIALFMLMNSLILGLTPAEIRIVCLTNPTPN